MVSARALLRRIADEAAPQSSVFALHIVQIIDAYFAQTDMDDAVKTISNLLDEVVAIDTPFLTRRGEEGRVRDWITRKTRAQIALRTLRLHDDKEGK